MFRAKTHTHLQVPFPSMIGRQSFGNLSVSKKVAISSISHSLCASPGRSIWSHGEEEESWWRGPMPKNQSHTLKSALIFWWKNGGGRQPSYMRDSCTSICSIKIHDISMHDKMPLIIKNTNPNLIVFRIMWSVPCHKRQDAAEAPVSKGSAVVEIATHVEWIGGRKSSWCFVFFLGEGFFVLSIFSKGLVTSWRATSSHLYWLWQLDKMSISTLATIHAPKEVVIKGMGF